VAAEASEAGNAAERETALELLDRAIPPKGKRASELDVTLGADTLYQEEKFIEALRERAVARTSASTRKRAATWARTAERSRAGRPASRDSASGNAS